MPELAPELSHFVAALEDWGCDSYTLDIRYLSGLTDDRNVLWDARIECAPLPPSSDNSLSLRLGTLRAGQIQRHPVKRKDLLATLGLAASGSIEVEGMKLFLDRGDRPLDLYTESSVRDAWEYNLHLRISGARRPIPSSLTLAGIDALLRGGEPPFDGLQDLAGWLGLPTPGSGMALSSIDVRIGPPVDIAVAESGFSGSGLVVTLIAHAKFDISRLRLAIRWVPAGLDGRLNLTDKVVWKRPKDGLRVGHAAVELVSAEGALAMLTIGSTTVRRHFFSNPERSRNLRWLSVQHFDRELRMIRQALLTPSDSDRFERAVAAVLFLQGFSPVVQLETDSPDLVVATPSGRIAIVECTIRVSDFASKIGKLVDRRGALIAALEASGHVAKVVAALACPLPRDRIASEQGNAAVHGIVVLSLEDLHEALQSIRGQLNPDKILDEAEEALKRQKTRHE